MPFPVLVTFRDMPVCDAVEAACWNEAERLERFGDQIVHCRVVIVLPPRGRGYEVCLDLTLFGGRHLITQSSGRQRDRLDVIAAIGEVFERARDQLVPGGVHMPPG